MGAELLPVEFLLNRRVLYFLLCWLFVLIFIWLILYFGYKLATFAVLAVNYIVFNSIHCLRFIFHDELF